MRHEGSYSITVAETTNMLGTCYVEEYNSVRMRSRVGASLCASIRRLVDQRGVTSLL